MDQNPAEESSERKNNEYLAEYNSLRSEIVTRIGIRNSIVFGTLTFAGVLLSLGLQTPMLAVIYTIISMLLAAAWVQSDVMISEIGRYIRNRIEKESVGLNWETFRQECRLREVKSAKIRPSVVFSTSGIFISTQMVALFIALSQFLTFNTMDWILCGVAVICSAVTANFFRIAYKQDTFE